MLDGATQIDARTWRRAAFGMFAVGWGANQFSPMLVVYREHLDLSTGTLAALFGVYVLGLIPGLLIGGPASDRLGRRPLTIAFVALSPLASVLLVLGRHGPEGLAVARLLAGACSGVVFASGSAWVQELSADTTAGTGARRAAIALTAGFASGPIVASLLAQFFAHPLTIPYAPHVVLGLAATAGLLRTPETAQGPASAGLRVPRAVRSVPFARTVAPSAPWVFGAASIAFAVLPGRVEPAHHASVAFAGLVTGVTLGCGVAIQGPARRLEDARPLRGGLAGLVAATAGILLGALAVHTTSRALAVVAAVPLGLAYGLVLVSGLRASERLADEHERGATLAVFYALTYVGFAAPYLLSLLAAGAGKTGALLIAAAIAALTALAYARSLRLAGAAAG